MNGLPKTAISLITALLIAALFLTLGCRTTEDGTAPGLPKVIPAEALPTALALPLSVPSPDSTDTAPALLRLHETRGDDARYDLSLHQKIRQAGPDLPTTESTIEQHLTLTERVTATAQDRDVPLEIVRHISVSDVTIDFKPDVADVEDAARHALDGMRFDVRSNPQGAVSSVTLVGELDDGEVDDGRGSAFNILSAALTQSALRLPDDPVSPGAHWPAQPIDEDIELPMTASDPLPAKLRTSYKLRGFTRVDGHRCAIIDVTLSMTVDGKIQAEDSHADVRGAARGEGVVLFDIDRGQVSRSAYSFVVHQELLIAGTNHPSLLKQDVRQTITLELQ